MTATVLQVAEAGLDIVIIFTAIALGIAFLTIILRWALDR